MRPEWFEATHCKGGAAMMVHGWLLFFAICGGSPRAECEPGFLMAQSCRAAEQFIRRGMRPGQVLHLSGCEERR